MKFNLSRRDFLKITLLSISTAFLAACNRLVKPTSRSPVTITPTTTNTPEPTATKTQTPTSTKTKPPTETPTPTEIPCFHLLTPENGAVLRPVGKVTFSWEAMLGAANYKLEIILPTNQPVIFVTATTSRDQYLEAITMGGEFHWQVTAFDSIGEVLCTTDPYTFEKLEYISPTATQKSGGSDGGGSGGNDGGGGGDDCPPEGCDGDVG